MAGSPPAKPQWGGWPHRPAFSLDGIIFHHCNKPGNVRSQCPELGGTGKDKAGDVRAGPLNLIHLKARVDGVQPAGEASSKVFKGFKSDGSVSLAQGDCEGSSGHGAGMLLLLASAIDLCAGSESLRGLYGSAPVQSVCEEYEIQWVCHRGGGAHLPS